MNDILNSERVFIRAFDISSFLCPFCSKVHKIELRISLYEILKQHKNLELKCPETNGSIEWSVADEENKQELLLIPPCGMQEGITSMRLSLDEVLRKNSRICNPLDLYINIEEIKCDYGKKNVGCDKQYLKKRCKGPKYCFFLSVG